MAGRCARTGPDLGKALKGNSAAFVRQSIIDPDAFVALGYPAHVMATGYGDRLGAAKLDALDRYLTSIAAR